jgi:hypothetical protein
MTSRFCTIATTGILTIAASLSASAFGQQPGQPPPNAPDILLADAKPASAVTYSSNVPVPEEILANPSGQQDQTPNQAASSPSQPDHQDGQTKRILGIIPNFRSVSANQHLPPQSVKEKFVTASQDSFDYSSIVVPALLAGYNQARNETPEFRQGGVGYSRYLWHSFVDQTSENYFVEFIVPAVAHEDTRYYTLGDGGFSKRALYAVKHVVVTRDDAGKNVFNAGEVLGSGMSAGLSNLYYPSGERTVGNTLDQWGLDIGIDAFTFAFREFWPDINHKLFHGSKE